MSIKLKIALYNTFLVSIVMILVLIFMMSISHSVVASSTVNQLKYHIHENADEVEWDNNKIDLDDVDFYENHITTLVYSLDGTLLSGYFSQLEQFTAPLTHGEVTNWNLNQVDYLLYDYFVENRKGEGVYLRGIVSVSEISATVELLFLLTLLALPVFILFTGFGSYFIAKKSMKPLEKMMATAEEITNGDDLSQRIALGTGKDEVHLLAHTFDTMFSQLEQAFISEKQFSSDVSHELRTPTAVILAECECNLTETSTEAEKTQALESIQRQGRKMQQIISSLLNLIRLGSGVQKANFEEVDFSELVTLVCEEQETLLPSGQQLTCTVEEGILCALDYGMMIRILSNLIENGLKYGKIGGYLLVTLKEVENQLILEVEDDGIGIAPENLDRIFHRFYQVDPARKREQNESMGLGLAMVKQMVKLHHGTISVRSILGEGTCFTVTLPKKQ